MNEIPPTERCLAAAAHVGFFLCGIGFLILPFIIKTIWKGDDFISGHAQQAFYIQIGAFIVSLLVVPAAFLVPPELAAIGGVAILGVAWAFFAVVGAYKALIGEAYTYPVLKLVHLC